MRTIGMDIHRSFAQVAFLEGGVIKDERRLELTRDAVLAFAQTLRPDDEVVLEATGNTAAVVRLVRPHVGKVAIANPVQLRAIAYARVKTDKIDAAMLARIQASGFLPEVWIADEATLEQRRLASERAALLRQSMRVKSRIHAILHANLLPPYEGHLFSKAGRKWLEEQPLPETERAMLRRQVQQFEQLHTALEEFDQRLAGRALNDPRARRLMTIAGISSIIATSVLAAIGEVDRFRSPAKLASYLGLTPKVRQSGDKAATYGRITKCGNSIARHMLVEAAWSASKTPGPLRAFFRRVQAKSGAAVAAVATARKMATLIWHMLTKQTDYAWARPAFVAMKLRKLELKAGAARAHGKAGPGHDYWIKEIRHREMELVARVEEAYARSVAHWTEKPA